MERREIPGSRRVERGTIPPQLESEERQTHERLHVIFDFTRLRREFIALHSIRFQNVFVSEFGSEPAGAAPGKTAIGIGWKHD
jgi:hypothetical protein